MAVPILRLNIDDNPHIIVKQDTQPVIVTGYTFYDFIASGGTVITETPNGNVVDVVIWTQPSSGVSYQEFWQYTGDTEIRLTGMTADILWNYQAITGLSTTLGQIGIELWDLEDAFTGHTGDSSIHFTQSAINIQQSQVSGLTSSLAGKSPTNHLHTGVYSPTGHTHTGVYAPVIHTHPYSGLTGLPVLFTGNTFVASGITQITTVGNQVTIYVPPDSITGITWSNVTGKPQWLSGTTLSDFQLGHVHSQYATPYTFTGSGATTIDETGNDIIIYTPTVNLAPYATVIQLTGHTSDTTIHFKMSGITISESQVTGLVGKYSLSGHTHPQYLTGFTVTAGDITGITQSLYAPIVHYHAQYLTGVTWNDVTLKPSLTLQSDFTGHTSDLQIHYHQSGISISESQVTGLVGKYSLSGHGHTSLTGLTISESQVTNLTADLASKSSTGHTHTQYLTGNTNLGTGTTIYSAVVNQKAELKSLTASNLTITNTATQINIAAGSIAPKSFWTGTEAQYAALGSYDNNTLYFCT